MRDSERLHDPIYGGSPWAYLGTPYVRYWLIDPATRTFTEGRIHRSKLRDELLPLIDTTGQNVSIVTMDDDNSLSVMALHYLVVPRTPAPDAAAFWYRPDIHEPAVRYAGKGLVVAHSRDERRLASQRLGSEHMMHLFHWERPTPEPHHLEVERLFKPARAATEKLKDSMEKVHEAAGGRLPGVLDLEVDARCVISVLELLADRRATCDELTAHDHGAIPFFARAHQMLTEEGYLDEDTESATLHEMSGLYGY